jgi:hypothetical protein
MDPEPTEHNMNFKPQLYSAMLLLLLQLLLCLGSTSTAAAVASPAE